MRIHASLRPISTPIAGAIMSPRVQLLAHLDAVGVDCTHRKGLHWHVCYFPVIFCEKLVRIIPFMVYLRIR